MRHGRIRDARASTTAPKKPRCRPICATASGARRALGNRGPIRFTAAGQLHPDILDAYWRCGFYIFEGVLGPTSWPTSSATCTTSSTACRPSAARRSMPRAGRRWARTARAPNLLWSKPLGDPFGGTELANGRHPVKMFEPEAGGRRAEGGRLSHPGLAAILRGGAARLRPSRAARRRRGDQRRRLRAVQRGAVHQGAGPRRLGRLAPGRRRRTGTAPTGTRASTASTSWPSSTAARRPTACGSCRARTSGARSTSRRWSPRPAASGCPTPCRSSAKPGDVAITNRQALHGSFANTSQDWRVTINFGFHRRRSVLGVKGGGVHNAAAVYDESASASAPA